MSKYQLVSPFAIEGELLGVLGTPGKPKYLALNVAGRELRVKLAKELRSPQALRILVGDRLRVSGLQTRKHALVELKAQGIENLTRHSGYQETPPAIAKILVCQSGKCAQRGGRQLPETLTTTLAALGQGQVKIEGTSCQKRCKQGPNFTIMPGNIPCSLTHPRAIAEILTQYLPAAN